MSEKDKRAKIEKAKAAQNEFNKSLREVENFATPGWRCQKFAALALTAPDEEVVQIVKKSFKAAQEMNEPYQRVAICAWPLSALIARKKAGLAQKLIATVLEDAQNIKQPVSKMDALELVWQAVYPTRDAEVKRAVTDALLFACIAADSWKAGRTMVFMAQVIASENKAEAQRVIALMREGQYKRQAQKRLDAGKFKIVRAF